jgi:TPP-dependent pyruvate/acetoin dehydrogenase alpha subunit
MAEQIEGAGRAVIAFCGDGALGAGVAYETLTIAAVRRLPLLVVCEDNGWQDRTQSASVRRLRPAELAAGLGLDCVEVDGNDVTAVHAAAGAALATCRRGGPRVLVATTYLRHFHAQMGPGRPPEYRPAAQREHWLARDPVDLAAARLAGDPTAIDRLTGVYQEVVGEMDAVVASALAAAEPAVSTAATAVTAAGWGWTA